MSAVAVFGAGGGVGRLLVPALANSGHDVTAVVRDPTKYEAPVAAGDGRVEVRAGDICDAASVRSVITGRDALVSVVGPPGARSLSLYSRAARAIVPAMEGAGAKRVLVMSSAGVRHDDPAFALWYRVVARTLMRDLYRDMAAMEETIRGSTLDWTFVRPTRITNDPGTGKYRVHDAATPPRGNAIPSADLVQFMVDEIPAGRWLHAAPTLAT